GQSTGGIPMRHANTTNHGPTPAWAAGPAPRRARATGLGTRGLALTALAAAILPAMAQTVSVDTRETTGDFERGIELEALPDSLQLQLSSGSVTTSGRFADAIFVNGGDAHTR